VSVATSRPARRRSKKDQAHDAELTQLGSNVAQIRYACEVVSQQPEPLTVQAVRTWLVDHGVADDMADDNRRSYVSRAVNEWRREHGVTEPDETALVPESPTALPAPTSAHAASDVTRDDDRDPVRDVTRDRERGVVSSGSGPLGPTEGHADAHADRDPVRDVTRDDDRDPVRDVTRDRECDVVSSGSGPLAPTEGHADAHADAHPGADAPTPAVAGRPRTGASAGPDAGLVVRSRRLRRASYVVLSVVAAAGAALSYQSLESAAAEVFPDRLAQVFPLLVDALIVGASLAYLAGAVIGRGRAGWRLTAHVGVGGTIFLNALAAASLATVPWHIAAPIVWSALVELTARDLLGDFRATHARPDSIPFALWLTAPGESAATWLRVRRQAAHASVRIDVGAHAAAREALRMALPGRGARRVRRVISRQLRAGSVTPAAVLTQAVAIMRDVPASAPKALLRDVLAAAVGVPTALPAQTGPERPSVWPGQVGGQLVKAGQREIERLRAAIRAEGLGCGENPVPEGLGAGGAASQSRLSPAPRPTTQNPYSDPTSVPEKESESPSQESISVGKSERPEQ
jgi:hypothetical protein